jgi:CheY-like chemotaxis protein
MKILIVDDERDVQFLFEQRFRKERKAGLVDFQFAFSAEEALDYLEAHGVAHLVLILSDINMPGMNGLDLLKTIKEQHPEMKVFMITAYGDDEKYNRAMEYGADDYLTKPLDFSELKRRISEFSGNEQSGA